MKITALPCDRLPELSPEDRADLAASIAKDGVLVPLLITPDGILIDGVERWNILQAQGNREFPPVTIIGPLSEDDRIKMRMDVNSIRRHLSRPERQKALQDFIFAAPDLTTREIAELAKVSQSTAARTKRKVFESSDSLIRPTSSTVHSLHGARMVSAMLADLPRGVISGGATPRRIRKALFDSNRQVEHPSPTPADCRLIHRSFVDTKLKPNTVDLGLSDPPWAWNANELASFMETYQRILRPGTLLAAYCGIGQIAEMIRAAERAGLEYWWQSCAINPSAKMASRKQGMVRSLYRSVLIFRKPGGITRQANHWLTDVMQVAVEEKDRHPWQQPTAESVLLLRGLSRPGNLVVDLTAGSGTTGLAAIQAGCRWIGYEIEKSTYNIASKAISDAARAIPESNVLSDNTVIKKS